MESDDQEMEEQLIWIRQRAIHARKQAGLSQAQAAKLLGLSSSSSLSDIETGRNRLAVDSLLQMSEVYSVDETWLLTGTNPNFGPEESSRIIEMAGSLNEDAIKLVELLGSLSQDQKGWGDHAKTDTRRDSRAD